MITAVAVRALLLARRGRLHAPRARRAAQPVRRPRRRAVGRRRLIRWPSPSDREPARRRPRAPPGPAHDAGHLRRHRRPGAAQAAAGALQPRPRGRAARALQPDRRLAPRPVRRRLPQLRARVDRAVLAPRRPTPQVLDGLLGRMSYLGLPVRRPRTGYAQARRGDRRARRGARPPAQPRLLPLDRAGVLPGHHRRTSRRPASTAHEKADVRVVIEKPFGTDLESARALQDGRPRRLPRAPGLPHRPLPGQGDRPERDGVPVRELHVRAGLEPQLHRPHPDHRGRGHRDRHPRRLLRPGGRAARPGAEPHAPAADARVHGAAGLVRGQQGARREGQGAAGDRAADARAGRRDDRSARRTRRGVVGRRGGCRATSTRRASRTTRSTETYAALQPRGPQLALGGRADLPAHRQAAGAQGHRDRGPAQAGAAPGVPVEGLGRRAAQPADPHHAAERGRVALARGEDPRRAACASAR